MNTLQGYVTPRSFNGYALPVPIQNKLLRTHAKENSMVYLLPQCELFLENNFMSLFNTINNLNKYDNLGMCSIYMLPDDGIKFNDIINILIKKKITLHFLFEELVTDPGSIKNFNYDRKINYLINSNNDLSNLDIKI